MVLLDIGRVAMKISGRESGKICCVVKKISNSFVLVTGPKLLTGVKRRQCNVEHLEPTQHILEIKEEASDEEVIEAYKKANLIAKFNLKLPSAAELKTEKVKVKEEKPVEKVEKKEKPKEKKTKAKK